MSYLGVPRLHFSGTFIADPSTINNTIDNYNHTADTPMAPLVPSWNPYGSASWSIAATVKSWVDADGTLHMAGDPVIGAPIASVPGASKVPAKLVDLDVDQQTRTQLFGLILQLTLPGGGGTPPLTGAFGDGARLRNLWFGRVPSAGGDSAAGGAFQSLLAGLDWGDLGGSAALAALREASPEELSIRLTAYAYDSSVASPTYRQGLIVGTLGPAVPGEPRHLVAGRLLAPVDNQPLWYVPGVVDAGRSVLTLDLGNAIPQQTVGGESVDLGTVQAAILAADAPVLLGQPLDTSNQNLITTAGVTDVPLTAAQLEQAGSTPLGLMISGPDQAAAGGQYVGDHLVVAAAEASDGLYVGVDLATARIDPGETRNLAVYVRSFGAPLAGYQVPLALMPSPNGQGANNTPASGLEFSMAGPSDGNGRAEMVLTGGSTAPKTHRRRNVEGQLYFVGGPWAPAAESQITGGPLTVTVYDEQPAVASPTWADVSPILYQYYALYAYMASIVDLSNYQDVKDNAAALAHVIELPMSDPLHMPVTRDLSPARRKMILDWLAAGCPS